MNVVFRVAGGDEAKEKKFGKDAEAAGIVGTPGHRSVGGMRVSLYNAVTPEAVQALVSFMREFQRIQRLRQRATRKSSRFVLASVLFPRAY